MKQRVTFVVGTVLAATLLSTVSLVAATTVLANAATTSPFDPSASGATQGTLAFYDGSGNVITSGNLGAEPAFVKANTDTGRNGDELASLYAYTPQKGVLAANWQGQLLGASTTYPITSGAPSNLLNKDQALAKAPFLWMANDEYPDLFPNNNSDAAWQDLYQLRLYTSGPGQALDTNRYASATIAVDSGTNTWSQVYPVAGGQGPVVSSAAAITGTAKTGYQLTCNATFTGADSVAFAWLRNGTAISGATASTYKTASADYQQEIKCRATGTNSSGSTASTSAAVTIALGDALVNTTLPKVTGTAAVGQTLSCSPGAWTPKAASYKYQWLRNGNNVQGATSKNFTVPTGYRGDKVACKVTASKKGFAKGVAKSSAVTIN